MTYLPKAHRYPNQIRAYRLQHGWTQKDLAHRLGVDPTTISTWEQGYVLARLPVILQLARMLDTLVEALYWPLYRPESPASPAIIRATRPSPHDRPGLAAAAVPFPSA